MIKVAFFDIDGTLLPIKKEEMPPSCIRALNQLQANGIKLIIATGRPFSVVPTFKDVRFDGILCFNGQMFYQNGQIVFKTAMDPRDIDQIIANLSRLGHASALANEHGILANQDDAGLQRYANKDIVVDPIAFEKKKKEGILQILGGLHYKYEPQILAGTSHSKITYWCDYGLDIIPANGGKAKGMEKVASLFGATLTETIAFGDGLNDLDMINAAEIGIAMGNAMQPLKDQADLITKSVEEDGIAFALKQLDLIA